MTLDELESLRPGEVVVFTKVDKSVNTYNKYKLGVMCLDPGIYTEDKHERNVVNFYRKVPGEMGVIAHFSYSICDYIERKVLLERDRKLNDILI